MFKKILLIIGFLLFLPGFTLAGYQEAKLITVTDARDPLNNFLVVENEKELWLIHHKTGCGSIKEGDQLTLVIDGELDGNRDFLRKGSDRTCMVDQAEPISGKITIISVSGSSVYSSVSDQGKPYLIYYSADCKNINNMNGQEIYVRKFGGNTLQAGDKIFLPAGGESCTLTYVEAENTKPPKEKEDQKYDNKRPTTPTHVRAIPSKSGVYLYWKAATDNEGIAYYIISASLYHRDDEPARDPDTKPQSMPDTFKTPDNKNSFKLNDLESDETYFFRVIAVDTSGNQSSYWSEEATATTKSSIATISAAPPVLSVFLAQETDRDLLFQWNSIPGSKYTVILEVDKKRVDIRNHWQKTFFRVTKKTSHEGKKLKLIIRSLDFRSIQQEDSIEWTRN